MTRAILMTIMIGTVIGCAQPPDTDVTPSPHYNFSSFSGTVWKAKVKTVIGDVKRYTNEHALTIFPPEAFDPTHPKYRPVHDMRIITELPVGTRLRIGRLMKDNGNWGGVRVTVTLENGTYSNRLVYLDRMLLAQNRFITPAWSASTNWDVNPEMLEKWKE